MTRASTEVALPGPPASQLPSLPAASLAAVAPVAQTAHAAPTAPADVAFYAKVLAAKSVREAGHSLVTSLVVDFGYTHASIGLHERGRTHLLAGSGGAESTPGAAFAQHVVGAMDEAIEQGRSLAWPIQAQGSADTTLEGDDPICFEHRQLHELLGAPVASVPLGIGGEAVGALTVERRGGVPIGRADLERLEQLMLLVTPALRWMQQGAQPWYRRAWRDGLAAAAALRQPQRRTQRRWLVAGAALLAFLGLAPLEHDVSGRARLEGAEQRVLAAPTDGFVKTSHVRPGDRVRAGDPLVDLVDGDLRLERERWSSQLAQHENAYAAAMAKSDRAVASTSLARISEAQAQLALVDEQLLRGRIVAPFDALVIQGDLAQSIGAPVRQGDTLLTLATTGRARVIVEVDEVDIGRVQPGQRGSVALSSLPWDREAVVVERIAPIAKAVEGRNVFEVEAQLVSPRTELRPGLLGRADVVVGRQPPLWVWTGRAVDRLRVAWWAWLG